jgi:hypothetical protein
MYLRGYILCQPLMGHWKMDFYIALSGAAMWLHWSIPIYNQGQATKISVVDE